MDNGPIAGRNSQFEETRVAQLQKLWKKIMQPSATKKKKKKSFCPQKIYTYTQTHTFEVCGSQNKER
jgi:hypothetical protein